MQRARRPCETHPVVNYLKEGAKLLKVHPVGDSLLRVKCGHRIARCHQIICGIATGTRKLSTDGLYTQRKRAKGRAARNKSPRRLWSSRGVLQQVIRRP